MNSRFAHWKRRLLLAATAVVVIIILFPGFLAPYDPARQTRTIPGAGASSIHFRDANGNFHRPFIHRSKLADPLTRQYEELTDQLFPVTLFASGETYSVFGLFESGTHLFGIESAGDDTVQLNLLGTDALGRDRFSRLLFATRFSLMVALAGVVIASFIGLIIGLISGYSSRSVDTILMSFTDSVLALPALILILGVRVAFPLELPPLRAATLLILIFAFAGWASMARLTRGLVRATREREYVKAAKSTGSSEPVILLRHILPNIAPVLITQATLMLPYFLLTEVTLSFLGVGLQEPVPSLGNLLAAASDLGQLRHHPFLLLSPAVVIFVFVLIVRLSAAYFQKPVKDLRIS
jgi:peptide/nickel transport system permease protein